FRGLARWQRPFQTARPAYSSEQSRQDSLQLPSQPVDEALFHWSERPGRENPVQLSPIPQQFREQNHRGDRQETYRYQFYRGKAACLKGIVNVYLEESVVEVFLVDPD